MSEFNYRVSLYAKDNDCPLYLKAYEKETKVLGVAIKYFKEYEQIGHELVEDAEIESFYVDMQTLY